MDNYLAAIGRDVGKVDTDSGGLARYSLKLEVPPGINNDTEPELSLEYCQGGPNGSLGAGWVLGGVSCIRRGPSSLAYDGFNPLPQEYDPLQPRLTLDGAELLNISDAKYGADDAKYSTEMENVIRTVMPQGSGFLVKESTGRQLEYGTSADSRVLVAGTETIREWRLKETSDYYGNTITYNYLASPRASDSTKTSSPDINTCYLSSIEYTSNKRTGYRGNRFVKLEYADRPDAVVQTVQGDKCTWSSLLTAVHFGAIRNGSGRLFRSYELSYSTSEYTGDSQLTSVTETSLDAISGKKVSILPTAFGYTGQGPLEPHAFKTGPTPVTTLVRTTNNIALFPMNITGRCLADIACVRYNANTKEMSLKAYLATANADGSMSWRPSDGPGAETILPPINVKNGFPSILSPDMNNDGRADFIVPYSNSDNRISFSISQCVGTGFQKARTRHTNFSWSDGAKFMTMDLTGRGTLDIVQIFATSGNKLAFRNFPSVNSGGLVGIGDAVTTMTKYQSVGTVDWFQLSHAGTGAKSLVRIWGEDLGRGFSQMKATTFSLARTGDSAAGFQETETSLLGTPVYITNKKYSVLPCDINADGTMDLVLATSEYKDSTFQLTFDTYLGNGHGTFTKHGETTKKTVKARIPSRANPPGDFHVTNINGSNYPSLSYVYQESTGKAYSCISFDGRSDGFTGDPVVYPLVQNLPSLNMQVSATDLNGNGMGDWLFHTIENDLPKLVPVYNHCKVTGFLEWAEDPMGLRTTIEYGCLTDPMVYSPGVDWKNYENGVTDSYPVIAAPNMVVTTLKHQNVSTINCMTYSCLVRKTYGKARINSLGRGWQGFEEINTLNTTTNILTTEKYMQSWPFTGTKVQLDTSEAGVLLRSIKTSWEASQTRKGSWNIYRTNRILEQTNMLENQQVVRSSVVRSQYDVLGNMTLRAQLDIQKDKTVFESWKRCSFTTIDGVTNVLTAEKTSAVETNTNMNAFEPGDCSLTIYENDASRATLKSVNEWSTDVGAFSKSTIQFNAYGKQVLFVNASGLQRTTEYDDVYNTFPVKVVEHGHQVGSTVLTAFDEASGIEVARKEENGLLTCYRTDGFGRVREIRALAAVSGSDTIPGTQFLSSVSYVCHPALEASLGDSHLEPQREVSFERQFSPSGAAYCGVKVVTHAHAGISGQHELVEYMDCTKAIRKRSSADADDVEKIWIGWEHDLRGNQVFESLPTRVPTSIGLDWLPDPDVGTISTFDALDRPKTKSRPGHGEKTSSVLSTTDYFDGGARVLERTYATNNGQSTQLAQLERRYISTGRESLIVENTDENGLRSSFQYDAAGRLTLCIDPAGKAELRSYNSRGSLMNLDNIYQNTAGATGTPAVTSKYDIGGQLIARVNAANEQIFYKRDSRGRLLEQKGSDGRTVQYRYHNDEVASITTFALGPDQPFESQFEFTYDHRGRVQHRQLTLGDGKTYRVSLSYDWQDRVVQKVLPDFATVLQKYRGSEITSTTLASGSGSTWMLEVEASQHNVQGKPEKLTLRGTGVKEAFTHGFEYDSLGFPVSHRFGTETAVLVQEHYLYNGLDQMVRKHEMLTGSTTDYRYKGRRLESSQVDAKIPNVYSYDDSGNLTQRRGLMMGYRPGKAVGSRDGEREFEVTYDGVGRVIQRETSRLSHAYTYDTLGCLQSITDTSQSSGIHLISDYDGETLQRKHSDGSVDLFVSDDFSVHVQADGSRIARHTLTGDDSSSGNRIVLGTVSNMFENQESKRALGGTRSVNVHFSDTKGNTTHTFKAEDGSLYDRLEYDDYGLLDDETVDALDHETVCTYEGKYLDKMSGLVNFGGRWYDPLVGRFIIPDDILDTASLVRADGLNRYAFENNDPINHIDPTGHWTWSSVLGVVAGVALVVAAVALTVVTGGAAAPLIAAGVGALSAGGIAGITYSVTHRDEENAGKFWGGFATTVAINATIGALTGGLGAATGPAKIASTMGRIALKAAIGGTASVMTKAAERGIENQFYGTHHSLFEGAGKSFLTGALVGGLLGAVPGSKPTTGTSQNQLAGINKFEGSFKLRSFTGVRQILAPKPSNPWANLGSHVLKVGGKAAMKPTIKLGKWGSDRLGFTQAATQAAGSAAGSFAKSVVGLF